MPRSTCGPEPNTRSAPAGIIACANGGLGTRPDVSRGTAVAGVVVRDVEHVEAGAPEHACPRGGAAEGEAAVPAGALRRAGRRQRSFEVADDEVAFAQMAADAVEDMRIGV